MASKFTKEDMNEWLLKDGRGIVLMGDYLGKDVSTTFRCAAGHDWLCRPSHIKRGIGCRRCTNTKPTTDDINQRLLSADKGISLVGKYITAKTKTLFQCKNGHQWMATPTSIINSGTECPYCIGTHQPTTEEFSEWLIMDGRGITLLGDYVTSKTKTKFLCAHGHDWMTMPSNIKNGSGCPYCASYGFSPDKPAWVYGFTRNNYLKVGITNDLSRRISEHLKHGEISMIYEKYYPVGKHAADFERSFKMTHRGHHVTKEECPDGYTETFPLHLVEELVQP